MSKEKLAMWLLMFYGMFASCNPGDKKRNFENELDQYFAKNGPGIKELVSWIDINVKTDRSFVFSYRVKANQVFCYYLDSNMRRGEYFELSQPTPDSFMTLLDKSTINDIIKFNKKDYYQVEIAAYSTWGYNVQILTFKDDLNHEDKINKLTKFIDSTAGPESWVYKEDKRCVYLISAN